MKNVTQETIVVLGGDGYLGWSIGLAFANRTDKRIVLADNLVKRQWEKEVDAKLLVPLKSPKARVAEYTRIFGKTNLTFEKVELLDQKAVAKLLKKYRPTVVINAAQQPSAPFSMMSAKNAGVTFSNNINGHLNVLWAIAEVDKSITYIKLGSAGCYMDTDMDYLPLGKKDFSFQHRGRVYQILQSFVPMQATDFYHQSKISDFLLDDLCARLWNLKVITVQQSTIFGATIDENHAPENAGLSARFNYDAVFSTVMNRFVCQVAIGHPLTVYGDGKQKTGIISLNDTIENFMEFSEMKVKPGEHLVVHNYTHRLSIEEIAQRISQADPSAVINYIKNPRQEPEGKLDKKIEVHKTIRQRHTDKERRLQAEVDRIVEFTKRYKDNIDTSIIMPTIKWTVEETEAKAEVARAPQRAKLAVPRATGRPLVRKFGEYFNIFN